jgi:hypothetical protein
MEPSVALGGEGQVYVAWVDDRNAYVDPNGGGSVGNPDIYFAICETTGLPQAVIRPIVVNPIEVSLGDDSPPTEEDRSVGTGDTPGTTMADPARRRGCGMGEESMTDYARGTRPMVETHPDSETAPKVVPVPTAPPGGCRLGGILAIIGLGLVLGRVGWDRQFRAR